MVVDGRRKRELTAAALKEWEDWEWQQILSEAPEKRTRLTMEVTVGGGLSPGGPWLSRTWRLPFGGDGKPPGLTIGFKVISERNPDEVETVVLGQQGVLGDEQHQALMPDGAGMEPLSQPEVEDSQEVQAVAVMATQLEDQQDEALDNVKAMLQHEGDGTIRDIEYSDYEGLYRQWKNKDLTDEEVARVGGPQLLDLMQAQWVMDVETQPDQDLGLP